MLAISFNEGSFGKSAQRNKPHTSRFLGNAKEVILYIRKKIPLPIAMHKIIFRKLTSIAG